MAMRAYTEAIVVIEAVFQAAMSWLNAIAPLNACEPSHTLSKSLRTIEDAKYAPEMREARRNERSTEGSMRGCSLFRPRPMAYVPRSAASQAKAHTRVMANGAYAGHRRHRSSVPGSDVRVEHHRPVKRLRAKQNALQEPSPHEPRAPTGQSTALCTQRLMGRMRVCGAMLLALDHRDAAQLTTVGQTRRALTGAHVILER
jgi:hypothetical protein